MAQLTALVDKLLTNVSNGLFQGAEQFIAEKVFPTLEVKETSGKLGKYGTSFLRIEHDLVGGRGEARRVEPTTRSTATYLIEEHALEGVVTKSDYRNVEKPYDAERDETMGVTSLVLLGKEYALSSVLSNTSTLTQNETLSGISQFSDYANSDPLGKVSGWVEDVYDGSGTVVNTIITSWKVVNKLKYHPSILESLGYKHNRPGALTLTEIAQAFGVDKVIVGSAVYESAKEGQTSSLAALWGKHMIFAHLPDKAMPYQKSLGYYMKYAGESSRNVYKYPLNNPTGSKGIIVEDNYQFLIADANCGFLAKDVIS